MSRRPRWTHVVIALGVIAAIAIAVPALGVSKSIKKLIRKEVAKQISKATGPTGPAGPPGANGANGLDGTARAYARVHAHNFDNCSPDCTIDRAKGITGVTRAATGRYCITASGIDSTTVPAAVTVDFTTTAGPTGNAVALLSHSGFCSTSQFKVQTERQNLAANTVDVADDVGFTIVIP